MVLESYDSTTLFFSDIQGFADIAFASTPIQVCVKEEREGGGEREEERGGRERGGRGDNVVPESYDSATLFFSDIAFVSTPMQVWKCEGGQGGGGGGEGERKRERGRERGWERGDSVVLESYDSTTLFFSDIQGFADIAFASTPIQVCKCEGGMGRGREKEREGGEREGGRGGNSVVPESYDSATLFFSDIQGFADIAFASTPIQVCVKEEREGGGEREEERGGRERGERGRRERRGGRERGGRGDNVVPESCDSATLFFSDIQGFADIAFASTPIQVCRCEGGKETEGVGRGGAEREGERGGRERERGGGDRKDVVPESYDSATLFFSDIQGFADIAFASTPIQVCVNEGEREGGGEEREKRREVGEREEGGGGEREEDRGGRERGGGGAQRGAGEL